MLSLASVNINGWFKIVVQFVLVFKICEQLIMKARVFKAKMNLDTELDEN